MVATIVDVVVTLLKEEVAWTMKSVVTDKTTLAAEWAASVEDLAGEDSIALLSPTLCLVSDVVQ